MCVKWWCRVLAAGGMADAALAHTDSPPTADGMDLPLFLAKVFLFIGWAAYMAGASRSTPPLDRQLVFHGSVALATLAMFGPIDRWASHNTAWHMVQHMMLIMVIAPLLVLARPLATWRAAVGGAADRLWRVLHRLSRHPLRCAVLHAAAIWIWHAPAPYLAALSDSGLHVIEHFSFLFTGWIFWWSVLRPGRHALLKAALALLFTGIHTGLLGALLTFAPVVLYTGESRSLADQQLAGLMMWIPAGTIYMLAAGWAVLRWFAKNQHGELRSLDVERSGTDGAASGQ